MSLFQEVAALPSAAQSVTLLSNNLKQIFIVIKLLIGLFGTVIILIGASIAIYRYFSQRFTHSSEKDNLIRLDLARTIVLGLEFFIASDVIETTIAPDFQALGILASLVVIRTVLNFSLHKEIKELSSIPGSGIDMGDEQNK